MADGREGQSSHGCMRTGTSISVLAHVAALTACLILAGVRPFEPTTAEAISVEIVTPDELPKEKDKYDFPTLSEKEQQAAPETAQQPAPPPAPEPAKAKPDSQQAALQQKPAEQPKPPEQPKQREQPKAQPQVQQQPSAQPPQPQAQPEVPKASPDITSQFGMMFSLPDGPTADFDAKATAAANITVQDAAALRAHIKSCSVLPKSISLADNVRIVLRVSLGKDGRLAREPLLIEASASEKGPDLMRSAMDALEKCQPYAMLPPERYNEWRMLDLSFTPKDFQG